MTSLRWKSLALGTALAGALSAGLAAAGSAGGAVSAGPGARAEYHQLISVKAAGTAVHMSQSNNWSGYNQGILDTKTPFASISGSWVVPYAKQHTKGQAEYSSSWIGIGGGCLNSKCTATDNTLIQAGTEQDVAANGATSYSAWWEIIPAPSYTASIKVHPGDHINCSLTQAKPEVWTIKLVDTTDHQSFTQTVPYASDESTAEWIEETPVVIGTGGTGLAALPNLGSVHFTNAKVNGKSAHLVAAQGVQLINSSGKPIATPSKPYLGIDFNDCTWATTCSAP